MRILLSFFVLFYIGWIPTGDAQSSRRSTRSGSQTSTRARTSVRSGRTSSRQSTSVREGEETKEEKEKKRGTSSVRSGRSSARSGRGSGNAPKSTTSTRSSAARSGRGGSVRSGRGATPATPAATITQKSKAPARSGRSSSARSGRGGTSVKRSARSGRASSGGTVRAGRSRGGGTSSNARSASSPIGGAISTGASMTSSLPSMSSVVSQSSGQDMEQQILSTEECKKRHKLCMKDFCNDENNKYKPGTCLCHASVAKLRPLEDGLFDMLRRIQMMNAQKAAIKSGATYSEFNEAAAEQLGLNNEEDEDDPWADSVDYGLDNLLDEDTKRKEGPALYKEASEACKQYIDLCPLSKRYIVKTYEAQMNKDCIAYSNNLRQAKQKAQMVMQKLFNDQKEIEHKISNKYDAGECANELKSCMIETAGCGTDFANCSTQEILKEKKIYCKDILDQCQDVKQKVWEKFLRDATSEGQSYTQAQYAQCARDLQSCMLPYCGENWIDCATDADLNNKKPYCQDKLIPCEAKMGEIWNAFKKDAKGKGKKAQQQEQQQEQQEQQQEQQEQQEQQQDEEEEESTRITKCNSGKTSYENCMQSLVLEDITSARNNKCFENLSDCKEGEFSSLLAEWEPQIAEAVEQKNYAYLICAGEPDKVYKKVRRNRSYYFSNCDIPVGSTSYLLINEYNNSIAKGLNPYEIGIDFGYRAMSFDANTKLDIP